MGIHNPHSVAMKHISLILALVLFVTVHAQELSTTENDSEDDDDGVLSETGNTFDLDTNTEFVGDEDADEEFFASIMEDTMMQQVIADMNGLETAIEREKLTRGGNVSDLASNTLAAMKRFADLKKLVSWLQPKDKRISRYCFYGCWCLPEGAHGFVAGTGRPVDNVDKACQYLWFCYTCAKEDFGSCNPNTRRYAYRFTWNPAAPQDYEQRGIQCNNGWRRVYNKKTVKYNCARAICECDKGLAIRLYKYWTHWDKSRHRIWSRSTDDGLFIVEERCLYPGSEGGGPDHELICCGRYSDLGSRLPTRDHGGAKECCPMNQGAGTGFAWFGNMFNTLTQCCKDGVVVTPGDGQGQTCN